MDFSCVGFDLRQWPWAGPFNADDTEWERNDARYSELIAAFGLCQNEYQVLEIEPAKVSEALALVSSWTDCNLLAIEYPSDIVRLRDLKLGFRTSANCIELEGFICRGLDVCDFNGLFSVLHHPGISVKRGSTGLFEPDEILPALELLQFASVLDPAHAPYSIARVWSSK